MTRPMRWIFLLAMIPALLAAGAQAAGRLPGLRLGAVGYAGESVGRTVRLLADFLTGGLGRKVELVLYPKYEEILQAIDREEVELAILPPVVFLMAQERSGVKPIANPVYQSGESNYRAVILAGRDRRDISQLFDLRGRSVAFVDRLSASGYVVPRGLLSQAGLTGKNDVKEVFTGNHVKSIQALLAGEVDAAATYDMLLAETPSLGKSLEEFQVLARSEPIPGEVLVGARKLSARTALLVRSHLMAFGKARESDTKLEGCLYQWFFAYDADRYEAIRKLWKARR